MLALLLTVVLLIISYFVWQLFYWKRRGITGPPPKLFLGNLWDLNDVQYPGVLRIRDWTKKYGPVYGISEGTRHTLIVSDVNMLQELFVKKFDDFYARKPAAIGGDVDKDPRVHVFEARGSRWKRLRVIAAPTFSSASLKKISATIEDSADELVYQMKSHVDSGKGFNIHNYYKEYTMDVISRIAMGQTTSQFFNNPAVDDIQQIFLRSFRHPVFVAAMMFPRLRTFLRNVFTQYSKLKPKQTPFLRTIQQIEKAVDDRIELRAKEGPREAEDFIDLFLDAKADTVEDNSEYSKATSHVSRSLTREEIAAQCFVFLLAGFDTTANSLAYVSYLLAKNPQKQKKLQEEIDSVCNSDSIGYDDVQTMPYLDAVVKESLRMFPLGAFVNSRECMRDSSLGSIPITKGMTVQADVWTIHYDKTIWGDDADSFVPERWQSGESRPQMAWFPFGAGPRICIGMRLAYLEEKLALAKILKNFSIVAGPETEKELKLQSSTTVTPEAVTVRLESRVE